MQAFANCERLMLMAKRPTCASATHDSQSPSANPQTTASGKLGRFTSVKRGHAPCRSTRGGGFCAGRDRRLRPPLAAACYAASAQERRRKSGSDTNGEI